MNRWSTRLLLFAFCASLALATHAADSPSAGQAAVVLKGLDPVLLAAGEERSGSEQIALERGRFRYLFATAENRSRFAAEPEKYEIQLDGHCAAMSGATGDPNLFAVHDHHIYLFGSTGCREAFVANPAQFLGGERRRVAILVFDGVELLDFAGPGEVFAAAGHGAFEVFTVGETRAPIVSQGFVQVTPEHGIADSPVPDVLVIPGGGVSSVLERPALMSWIKSVASKATVVMSVCNGAFVLADAGLLDGLEATTHHGSIAGLRRAAPRTVVHDDRRFVDNGKVVTAAGVSAGIDAALHVVARLLTPAVAEQTARYMEYRRDGSDAAEAPRQASRGAGESGR